MHRQLPQVVFIRIVLALALAHGLVGCDSTPSRSLVGPSPIPSAAPPPPPSQPVASLLTGHVFDGAFRPLADVGLEIVEGPQVGGSATSDARGRFSFSGRFDDTTRVRATKEGYVATTGAMTPSCATCNQSNRSILFYLAALGPPVNIVGHYTLTFVADSSCALPDDMRTRTYAATISPWVSAFIPAAPIFNVTVSGASFFGHYDGFSIGIAGDHAAIEFGGEGPAVVEHVATNTYLAFDGRAAVSITTPDVSTISTSFEGTIDYCEQQSAMGQYYDCRPTQGVVLARCTSTNHQLILTRR